MKYKMLVLDVDGTLLNDNKEISKRTLATLRKVQQMGVRIMLASGRPTYGLLALGKELELDTYNGYVMSYNGGRVIRAADGATIFERRINPELIPYLEKKANKNGFGIMTYNEDCIVTNMPDNPHIKAEAKLNGMRIVYEEHFSIAIDFIPCKCMLVSDDEEALVGLENHWKRRLDGVLDVFRSEPFFLEVVGCRVNKANTLAAVMEMEGIKTDEIVVFGDGVADVTMLQLASLGIAMGNAPGSVKRCADYITLSNNEDGVAVAVEKVFLSEVRPSEIPLDKLNEQSKSTLMGNLGIQYTYASRDRVEATMPVDHRNRQPFGILHGGATGSRRDGGRIRLYDNMQSRRICCRHAGKRQPHIVGSRGRHGARRGHYCA